MSPGTSLDAGIRERLDDRKTKASSGEYSFRACNGKYVVREGVTHVYCLLGIGFLDDTDGGIGDEDEQDDQWLDKGCQPGASWLGGIFKAGEDKGDDGGT